MTDPKVDNDIRASVVMCVYNGERYLDAAIASIRNQSVREIEIIVVDDGSTDGSAAILRRHADDDPRIRVSQLAHVGLANARNHGLAMAAARRVALMDADDVAMPDRLRVQLDFLAANPDVVALGSSAWRIGPSGHRRSVSDVGPRSRADLQALRTDCKVVYLIAPTVMLDREVALAAGGFRDWMYPAEDADLWTRLADTHVVMSLSACLLEYRIHAGSVSTGHFYDQMERLLLVARNTGLRRSGRAEVSPEAFHQQLAAQPWRQRLARGRIWRARYLYRVAGGRLTDGRIEGLVWLVAAAALAPGIVVGRLWRQLGPHRKERPEADADRV